MVGPGDRVFFKRRARQALRSYWGHRYDALDIRREVLRHDRPRYYVEEVLLDGLYARLSRLPFLWYAGVFSVGRHRPPKGPRQRARWVQDPVHLPVRGLGPRALVFPPDILDQLHAIPLLGTHYRYTGVLAGGQERVTMRVHRLSIGVADPVYTGFGPRTAGEATLRLEGVMASGPEPGRGMVVPVGEVFWQRLVRRDGDGSTG